MAAHRLPRFVAALLTFALVFAVGCGSEGEAADGSDASGASDAPGVSPSMTDMQSMQTAAQAPALAPEDAPTVLVYKSPTCGCCEGWVEHMRTQGYEVEVEDRTDIDEIKNMLGIPFPLRSCHTAQIGRYLVEGHVPAGDVHRLLAEEPRIAGIATPGMPVGSPGMEVPGREPDSYDVMAFDADGRTTVYASH